MSCARLTPVVEKRLRANSAAYVNYEWFTDWMPCPGLDTVRALIKIMNADSGFEARFAFQTAEVRTDDPGDPTFLGGDDYHTGEDEYCTNDLDISAYTADAFFVRFGIAYKTDAQSVWQAADVSFQAAYGVKGNVVGKASQEVIAPDDTYRNMVISDWVPALSADSFKVALVVNCGDDTDFYTKLAYQTAAGNTETPDAWTGGGTEDTGDRQDCETVSTSTSNKMWVRFGVAYKADGSTNLSGYITAAVSTKG